VRILFDTNVVLDVLLARSPHHVASTQLMDGVARKTFDGLLCATTITTIHYLASKAAGTAAARRHVTDLLNLFEVAAVTRVVLLDASRLGFIDYEDAVLHEAGRHAGATGIVTRDARGFRGASLSLYEPAELLRLIQSVSQD
jgi:predicted nucleic acid-binding protein